MPTTWNRIAGLGVLVLALVVGCAGPQQGATGEAQVQPCTDPRPQICTLDYSPVCGVLGNQERKEYSNGCGACADPAVTSYTAGPCQGEDR